MNLLTNRKAVLGFVGAVIVVAVPVMADHKPGEVAEAFHRWLPAFYILAGLLVLYAVAAFAFAQGRATKELKGDLPIVVTPAKGRGIKDLIYAANQIASILLEQGELRVGALEAKYPALERDHDVWHDDEARVARNDLIAIARYCRDLRVANGPGWMAGPGTSGDFTLDQRAEYQPTIEGRRDRLIARLKGLERT